MTLASSKQVYTPDDLERLSDEGNFELVNGELLEKAMAKASNEIGFLIAHKLGVFLDREPIARVYPEQGFQCFAKTGDLTRIRKPDVAVVLNARVNADADNEIWFHIAPDIAIEVISPTDRASELHEKLDDYAMAEIPLVWVVYPDTRTIEVRSLRGPIRFLHEADELTAEGILPGFAVPVRSLFPPATPKPTTMSP